MVKAMPEDKLAKKEKAKRRRLLAFCRKAAKNPEKFCFVDTARLEKIHKEIRKIDEETRKGLAGARNYWVGAVA